MVKYLLVLFFIIQASFFILPIHAQGLIQPDVKGEILDIGKQGAAVGLGEYFVDDLDVRLYAARIVKFALGFLGLTLVCFLLYGGFLYLTSQGNEEKIGAAKKVITRAAIGTAIILSSYGITIFVTRQTRRAITQQFSTQSRSCQTTTGMATCCNEYNAYERALSSMPGFLQDPDAFERQYREQTAETRRLYNRWHDCWERETERVGLPSNLFD